jgi:hypothetical protein
MSKPALEVIRRRHLKEGMQRKYLLAVRRYPIQFDVEGASAAPASITKTFEVEKFTT